MSILEGFDLAIINCFIGFSFIFLVDFFCSIPDDFGRTFKRVLGFKHRRSNTIVAEFCLQREVYFISLIQTIHAVEGNLNDINRLSFFLIIVEVHFVQLLIFL